MRLLHVIPQFPYFGNRTIVGGHASSLLTLALAQQSAGNQVTILSYLQGQSGSREIESGLTVYSLFPQAQTRTIRFGLQFLKQALKWLTVHQSEFDVIHMHSGYADYFLVSSRLKAKTQLPVLHTMYCPIPNHGGRWHLPGVHSLIRNWANKIDWRGAISQNVAASMTAYGMTDVEHVKPALDIERFARCKAPLITRERLGLKADDLVVLFVGNARPQKNAVGVLRALHKLRSTFPNAKLIITTELKHSSSDAQLSKLTEEVRDLKIESCVVQVGIVDNMPDLMNACDVLVAPFIDSFGPSDYFVAALEAMACGKPVVVSDVGGMPEIISEDVGRLVNPNNVDSIASGLSEFLSDKELRMNTGVNAKTLIKSQFSPNEICNSYNEIYQRVLQ